MSVLAKRRALVIEDDRDVRLLVASALRAAGMCIEAASGGGAGLAAAGARPPDVVVLDLGLPDVDGVALLSRLRRHSDVPVVVISGRRDETERVAVLDRGADDYLVKPLSPAELVARVRAVLRRAAPASGRLDVGALSLDVGRREVTVDGAPASLTRREFDLLAHLARSPGRVHTREELLRAVWGSTSSWQDPATVTEHVRRIRRRLGDDVSAPRFVRTVRGIGYLLVAPT